VLPHETERAEHEDAAAEGRPSGASRFDRVLVGLLGAIVIAVAAGIALRLLAPAFERLLGSGAAPPSSARHPSTAETEAAESDDALSAEQSAARPREPREPRESNQVLSASAQPEVPDARTSLQSGTFALRTKNTIGRSGKLFLPAQAANDARPLLVLFHGTGGAGAHILSAFASIAKQRGIVVLAPDSGRSPDGNFNWQVPDQPGDTPPDVVHVRACLDELYATEQLKIDPEHVLAAGHSGGGSTAAYYGTVDARFRAFAVLHGGVFAGGLGTSSARGWFSTGTEDALRPPAGVESAAAAARAHAGSIDVRLYPGGHGLSAREITDLVEWWLDG
jgi:poly(3-hydroxybutyrate) depolymerase